MSTRTSIPCNTRLTLRRMLRRRREAPCSIASVGRPRRSSSQAWRCSSRSPTCRVRRRPPAPSAEQRGHRAVEEQCGDDQQAPGRSRHQREAQGPDGAGCRSRTGTAPAGISGYEIVSTQNTVSSAFVHNSLFLSCPPGKKVIGGGGATRDGVHPRRRTLRDERPAVDRRHRLADRHDARESGRLDTPRADHLRHGPVRTTTRSGTPRRPGRPRPPVEFVTFAPP